MMLFCVEKPRSQDTEEEGSQERSVPGWQSLRVRDREWTVTQYAKNSSMLQTSVAKIEVKR